MSPTHPLQQRCQIIRRWPQLPPPDEHSDCGRRPSGIGNGAKAAEGWAADQMTLGIEGDFCHDGPTQIRVLRVSRLTKQPWSLSVFTTDLGGEMVAEARYSDRKLREESLKAFVKALHTDRMVAVTGAMSTRALGYPSGSDFIAVYAAVADRLARDIIKLRSGSPAFKGSREDGILEDIRKRAGRLERGSTKDIDTRVSMWMLHEAFGQLDQRMRQTRSGLVIKGVYQMPARQLFEKRLARVFASRTFGVAPLAESASEAAIRPLIASLGIKRIATLNYDLELERAFMLRADERETLKDAEKKANKARLAGVAGGSSRARLYSEKALNLNARGKEREDDDSSVTRFMGPMETGKPILRSRRNRLSRTMGNGIHVESDIGIKIKF